MCRMPCLVRDALPYAGCPAICGMPCLVRGALPGARCPPFLPPPGWGVNYMSGSGLPLDWFDSDQQRHITAHGMDNIPTMTVLVHRSSHRDTVLDTTCLLCGAQPEMAPHLRACSA